MEPDRQMVSKQRPYTRQLWHHSSSLATLTCLIMSSTVCSSSLKYGRSSDDDSWSCRISISDSRVYSSCSLRSMVTWSANCTRHGSRKDHIVPSTFSRESCSEMSSRRCGTSWHQPCSTSAADNGTLHTTNHLDILHGRTCQLIATRTAREEAFWICGHTEPQIHQLRIRVA